MDTDVLIVGAGPAGLSLALALSHAGLHATVLEQQSLPALAQPAPDGREIALTQPSVQTLQRLGTWQRLLAHEQGFIRQAIVHDGPVGARPTLTIDTVGQDMHELGRIVPNCALRRTAFEAAQTHDNIRLITGATVTQVVRHAQCAQVHYQVHEGGVRVDAPPLSAPLVVAADSRFSSVRRMAGIGARSLDFGRTAIVCRMAHAQPHDGAAHECFLHGHTLAILPMAGQQSSAVWTVKSDGADALMALDDAGFALAVAVGLALGLAVGASPLVYKACYPLLVGFNSIPKVAFVPVLVVWFGIGTVPAILTAFLISFFPVVVNVATGLATLEPELEDVLRSLGARRLDILCKVGLPRALPYFFASLKVAITLAFVGSVISETVASNLGIGYLMMSASSSMNMPLVFAGLMVIGVMGVVMYELFALVERRLTGWAHRNPNAPH